MKTKHFTPKLFTLLAEGISREQMLKDITSGVIVGIIALPLAIAFAIASGVSPEKGIITAVIAGLIISVFGGSRVQIGGPTGAFIVIVYGIVQSHGVEGLIIATFLAGFIIVFMGLLRLGNYLRFIPYPLIVGFTSGIAVIIFSSQVKELLGLPIANVPADFLQQWAVYAENWQSFNSLAVVITLLSVAIILLSNRFNSKIPGAIVAIAVSTVAVYYFDLPVDTIESRFGEIPTGLSLPDMPNLSMETVTTLLPAAMAIALLGSIESLLSAVVADGMIGAKHRPNVELIAQGGANIASALFGGIPATGAIARTATNVRNGGRTPISGVVHAIVLLLIILFLSPIAKLIPLPCLAGILLVVAWHMGDWQQFFRLLKSNRLDVLVLLSTFFLTVFFDLVIAIEVGIVLSSFIFMKRMSEAFEVSSNTKKRLYDDDDEELLFDDELPHFSEQILLYEINGPLFFGASQKFQEVLIHRLENPKVLILRMKNVPFIDASGVNALAAICEQMQANAIKIMLSGAKDNVVLELEKSRMAVFAEPEFFQPTIYQALAVAEQHCQKV